MSDLISGDEVTLLTEVAISLYSLYLVLLTNTLTFVSSLNLYPGTNPLFTSSNNNFK
jgi:hypothetical protein